MNILVGTNRRLTDIAILLLRWTTGVILFVAGAGKVMGWFGGMGMEATIAAFKPSGINTFWTYVSCYAELIGGFLLIFGFLTRPAAFILFINMLVAVILLGTKNFFMGGGAYPFTLMITSLAILLAGPGLFSVDAAISNTKPTHTPTGTRPY
jgi:putative oxidoreductase